MTDALALAPVLAAARATGWHTAVLDLEGAVDKATFMDRCARHLDLPAWFGRNWDALADCLTDLSWAPATGGRLLVVSGWHAYARAQPREWGIAQEVLADAADHWRASDTQLVVLLTLEAGSIRG
ncbi:barstar family protein [Streptomyces apocyni]|uniref:barstar family protein n=1 Tax=Streptomyces apocyni TaxID=2654677 RepID=UPI0012E9C609|nr:barstar family protein [Streptomyces apocyni]